MRQPASAVLSPHSIGTSLFDETTGGDRRENTFQKIQNMRDEIRDVKDSLE